MPAQPSDRRAHELVRRRGFGKLERLRDLVVGLATKPSFERLALTCVQLTRGELEECSLGGRRLILASSLWQALSLAPDPKPDAKLLAQVDETFARYLAKEGRCGD